MVHCLSTETGKSLWTFRTNARVDSSPAVVGGLVYIGSSDGRLYGLDLSSGDKLWEFNAGAPLTASPAIASGRLVIGSLDGRVYCFGK
jgi:outer membrane protein assembly factor BamB